MVQSHFSKHVQTGTRWLRVVREGRKFGSGVDASRQKLAGSISASDVKKADSQSRPDGLAA